MKKMKKVMGIICLIVALSTGSVSIPAHAAVNKSTVTTIKFKPSANKVKRAYLNYLKKNKNSFPFYQYKMVDINKDGIKELLVMYSAGVRGGMQVFTYKNGVKSLTKEELLGLGQVYTVKNQKKICVSASNGASEQAFTYYYIKGSRLKELDRIDVIYGTSSVRYYLNGKKISKKRYLSYEKKLKEIKFS